MRSIAACLLLLLSAASASAAPKATTVSYANETVTIEIFIELFGEGASAQLAADWETLIEQHWNDAFAAYACDCFRIVVDAHVEYNENATTSGDVAPGWEGWEVKPREAWEEGDPEWTPFVEFPSGAVEGSDRYEGEAGSGQLPTDEPWVTIHEAGHLLGQDEGYYFPEGWEKGDPVGTKSGWTSDNIMAGPKISLEDWASNPEKYFSQKNYDEVQKAVLDYLREQGAHAPRGVAEMKLEFDMYHNSWGPAGPAMKNSEKAEAEIDLCVLFFAGKAEPTYSQGRMDWSPVSRVPQTWYGGNRTANSPFPVTGTGSVASESGFATYVLELDPHDLVSNFLKNGKAYATGGHLWYAFQHARFNGGDIKGSLKRLEISPLAMAFGESETSFTIESPVNQRVQTVGRGTLRIERSVLLD